MKYRKLIAIYVVQAFFAVPTMAQTPAEETVCEPLLEDGISQGLYGLCVAFCEAQDHADIATPITETELEVLMDSAPAGKILQNYNRRKAETDPPMPCVVVEEPCPCWTESELASIDGVMADGATAGVNVFCNIDNSDADFTFNNTYEAASGPRFTQAIANEGKESGVCAFIDRDNLSPGTDSRFLSTSGGVLTIEQVRSCASAVQTHIEIIKSSCTSGNQAP